MWQKNAGQENTNGTNVGLKVIRVSWEFMEWLWMDGA